MIVKPLLVVMDSTIYTVLAPAGAVVDERYYLLTTHAINVSELVYDLSNETYIKCRGEKTLGPDVIKNLYSMAKPITRRDFEHLAYQSFARKET